MSTHPVVQKIKFERTFAMIKPDGVMRGVVGDVIHRFEKVGLKIVAIKMLTPTEEMVRQHYPMNDDAWVGRLGDKAVSGFESLECSVQDVLGTDDRMKLGKDVTNALVEYMTSGPVVAMVVEGIQAIDMVRKLCGHTLPFKADVGTIRGDYSVDSPSVANAEQRSIHNIIHASENAAEAANEINLWFKGEKIPSYRLTSEEVMYSRYY
ncbi:MAG: nucleoside-diphosphate kinase [Acidobacteriota bacterium]|jgi:nucleoside-diphosphate kinase